MSNSQPILEATSRALAHSLSIAFPPEQDSENTKEASLYNDAAFYQRFHAKDVYEELQRTLPDEQSSAFLASLERLRYHLQGSYYYRGTAPSLEHFRQEFSFFTPDQKDASHLYNVIQNFLVSGLLTDKKELETLLKKLPSLIENPKEFLPTGLALWDLLRGSPSSSKQKKSSSQKEQKESSSQDKESPSSKEESSEEAFQQTKPADTKAEHLEKSSLVNAQDTSKRFIEGAASYFPQTTIPLEIPPYKVYTRQYDECISAEKLVSSMEKEELQKLLAEKSAPFKPHAQHLAQKLYRFLRTQMPYKWSFDVEEGMLNSAKLAQKIINPTFPYIFKKLDIESTLHTTATLLIDNSGSMRGRPILLAALCAQLLAETLEKCGVSIEILGFTTSSWKGGKSFQQWTKEGKPSQPGRLNDLRHIIYKSFTTPWYRAKSSMGVMLKEGILKENIDGEALLWAAKRLFQRQEQRKILIVISDGAPVDDMTLAHNGGYYLEAHLREVIRHLSHHPSLELFAIGIGHDVTRFYPQSITIKSADLLAQTLFEQLPDLFLKKAF